MHYCALLLYEMQELHGGSPRLFSEKRVRNADAPEKIINTFTTKLELDFTASFINLSRTCLFRWRSLF